MLARRCNKVLTQHLLVVEAALYELRDVVSEGAALGHDGELRGLQPHARQDHVVLLEAEAGAAPAPAPLLSLVVGERLQVIYSRRHNLDIKIYTISRKYYPFVVYRYKLSKLSTFLLFAAIAQVDIE